MKNLNKLNSGRYTTAEETVKLPSTAKANATQRCFSLAGFLFASR